MKISEVEVGKQYGALDRPTASKTDPRQVEVLEIVTVEGPARHDRFTGQTKPGPKRKMVKVQVLNGSEKRSDSWRLDAIARAAKGDKIDVEARQLVGLWSSLRKDILKRVAEEERVEARKVELERRFKALGFKCDWDEAHISVSSHREEVEFKGKSIDKLLAKLEA